jgi:ribosomal protein S18 acetylase RimI-like enzyme
MTRLADTYTLRPAKADDFELILELRVFGLREHVDRIWSWDDAAQRARFERRFIPAAYQVIVVEGRDVGAMAVEWTASAAFLTDIEIAPEWRGLGLGTAVLRDLLAEAGRQGLPVALQVLKGNPARGWYERLGFEIVGETATHIAMRAPPDRGGFAVDSQPGR